MKNKGFLIFLLCVIVLSIGYPILNKFYIEPKTWKKQMFNEIRKNNPNMSEVNAVSLCNCIYSSFVSRYGNVQNFPLRKDYSFQDKRSIIECTIDYTITDSIKKEYVRKKLDSLAYKL